MECSLFLFTNKYFQEAINTGKAPKELKSGLIKPLLKWKPSELLRVARAAKWLPGEFDLANALIDTSKVNVGDLAQMLQMLRNLVHPAAYIRDHHGGTITKNHFENSSTIYSAIRYWLMHGWKQRKRGTTLAP